MGCVLDTSDPHIEVNLPVRVVIVCEGPASPDCRCVEGDCDAVQGVEAYGWDDYWREGLGRQMPHQLVSDRWVPGCGLHTRVYVRGDGSIVFSHDDVMALGVHVLRLRGNAKSRLLEATPPGEVRGR